MKLNVFVLGEKGVGKKMLAMSMLPPPVNITTYENATIYSSEFVNFILYDIKGIINLKEFMTQETSKLSSKSPNFISTEGRNIVLFCINGENAKLSPETLQMIAHYKDDLLVIITKSDLAKQESVNNLIQLLSSVIELNKMITTSALNYGGLEHLTETIIQLVMQHNTSFANELKDVYSSMRENWQFRISELADSYIIWGAGRAAAIAIIPLPMADVTPLMVNECYMIYKLAHIYGYAINQTVTTMLVGIAGGSILGKIGASFIPFLKIPIAAAVTYGVGKATKAYFESGMTLNADELKNTFNEAKQDAKNKKW